MPPKTKKPKAQEADDFGQLVEEPARLSETGDPVEILDKLKRR